MTTVPALPREIFQRTSILPPTIPDVGNCGYQITLHGLIGGLLPSTTDLRATHLDQRRGSRDQETAMPSTSTFQAGLLSPATISVLAGL